MRNSFYHHGLVTNWSGPLAFGNYIKPFYSNNLALRDEINRIVKLKNEKYRIVFIGDSFTEGVGMAFDETFVGLISRKIDQPRFEILNASVISYSPKLYYLRIKYLLENVGLKFNELIVCVDISDIQDEIVYESFQPSDSFCSRLIDQLLFFIRNNSMIYREITEIQNSLNSRPIGSWQDKLEIGFQGLAQRRDFNKERAQWTYDEEIWRNWGEKGFRLATENMDKLLKLCRENGLKMAIAVYPWPSEFINNNFDSRNVKLWKLYSEKNGIDFINLYDSFDWSENPESNVAKYYIPYDMHFNESGNELVAENLFGKLSSINNVKY